MLSYYFNLALRSFRSTRTLTALMVLAIALGVGACMTTLTVFHVLSRDPIPQKSGKLFYPQIEPRSMGINAMPDSEPPEQMTRFDAEELLRQKRGDRQAVMSSGLVAVLPEAGSNRPFNTQARYTSADFFPMFDVPLSAGRSWTAQEDEARARVMVISLELAKKLFGNAEASIGHVIRTTSGSLQVIGVLGAWRMTPRFYDMRSHYFGSDEQIFVPFSTSQDLHLSTQGDMQCWSSKHAGTSDNQSIDEPCAWLQYWVELDTSQKVADYRRYLLNYSDQQRATGRFERPTNTRLRNVMEWLEYKKVVPDSVRLQMWLAFGFLLVCLVNTIGLLLAKFLRRSGEISVRRALGASRLDIFTQCLVEASCIGLFGAVLGSGLAGLGLWLVHQQPDNYAKLAQLDAPMLLFTITLSLVASLLAGLLPAWRAMQIAPAIQLKSQ